MQVRAAEWWLRPFVGVRMTTPSLVVACSGLKPLGLLVAERWKGPGLFEEMPGYEILSQTLPSLPGRGPRHRDTQGFQTGQGGNE